ncbi:RNA 2',3'-cyclic phosphodiesterase [uncultured Microbulbifer sp.]|uniref:RNA 2',3'-cyclic phosphodiesterase n=1 Tax=uncultured Microbulbifer sp. TaxID=348147 RepID=UPI00262E6903|nr:RNA 2',3'-cyclic phosphodiesterase [uncultured Microbulbifer sp.]
MQKEEKPSGQTTSRLFIGVRPDKKTQEFLDNLIKRYQKQLENIKSDHLRWTTPANRHLTLAFLGNTPREIIPPLRQGLIALAQKKPRFQGLIYSLNPFPRRNPKALVVELATNPSLLELHQNCNRIIGVLGITPEKRTYRPHITLARSKEGFEQSSPFRLDFSISVENITLYESTPKPQSSHYHPLLEAALCER